MSKLAVILVLLSTTAVLWHQTEAKPFLLLPVNVFGLTPRAPAISDSSSSTSSASGGLFQLPTNIISRKLSLINSLLSGFSSKGSFGLGLQLNAGSPTRRPTTTTQTTAEVNTVFTPEVTTKTSKTTIKTTPITEESSIAASTEKSAVSATAESSTITGTAAITTTTKNYNNAYDASTAESTSNKDDIVLSNNFEVITVNGNDDLQTPATVSGVVSSLGIDTTLGSVGEEISLGVSGGGNFDIQTAHTVTDNEIFGGNVHNMYLPVRRE